MSTKTSAVSRNAALDAAFNVLNGGYLRFYDGTQPADADTAISTQNKLAELALNATAFGVASAGTKTANAISSGACLMTATCTWATLVKSDGTRVQDMSVGTTGSGADLQMNAVAFVSGATISVTSLAETMSS